MIEKGDKVAFRSNLECGKRYGGLKLNEGMFKIASRGLIYIVDETDNKYSYVSLVDYPYTFTEEMFVKASNGFKTKFKKFKKDKK